MAKQKLYLSTSRSLTGSAELRPVDDPCHEQTPTQCVPQCLEQPRFFCGQLLTDQDLNALLQWSRTKFQLDRYKLGWGIVCGLHLRCDPNLSSGLLLEPGYAVDSCGNDIVACGPGALDLADACRLPGSHCEELAGAVAPSPIDFLGLTLSPGELVQLDIFIHYAEEETHPATALGRGACSERDACEFSRLRETYTLGWRYASTQNNGGDEGLWAWEEAYFTQSRRVVDRYVEEYGDLSPDQLYEYLEEIKCWLLEWIGREGLYHFCALRDAINNLSTRAEDLEAQITRILFFLVIDARLAYLAPGCPCGDPQQGVPLGRVWLRRRGGSNRACEIVHIDSCLPYRRPLQSDMWPAPFNHLNLGQFVCQPVDWVCTQLRDHGVTWNQEMLQVPESAAELQRGLDEERQDSDTGLFLNLGCDAGMERPLKLAVYNEIPLVMRVCSFSRQFDYEREWRPERPMWSKQPHKKAFSPETERPDVTQPPAEPPPTEERSFDPLTTINGIGEEREYLLRQHDITTYKQLAKADIKQLRKLFPRVKDEQIEDWRKQAKQLQRGK